MSTVFITIQGDCKKSFAHALHGSVKGGVDLVILQKKKQLPLFRRLARLFDGVNIRELPKEIWYAALLHFSKKKRIALDYFRACSHAEHHATYPVSVMEVDSINSDEVYEVLKELSPQLLVIWGTAIIKPHIIKTAKHAINLHMGYCPYYRGAVANQYAVLEKDFSKIGATIHYAEEKVDAGNIITQIKADTTLSPKELFTDLNDRAQSQFLKTAKKIVDGKYLPTNAQEISNGRNCLMRDWTHAKRYALAKQVLRWEKKGKV